MAAQKPAPQQKATAGDAWSVEINLAGSEPASVSGSKDLPPNAKGKVKCKCLKAQPLVKQDGSGKRSFIFSLQVVEPAFLSGLIFGKVNADPANEKAKNFWNTTLQSFGAPAGALQKGTLKLSASTFVGKTCFMYLDPEKDSKGYDKREFLTPTDFEAQAWPDENAEVAPAAAAASNGAPAATQAPAWE